MKIARSFTNIHGPDYRWEKFKEGDYMPEHSNLLHAKLANPLK